MTVKRRRSYKKKKFEYKIIRQTTQTVIHILLFKFFSICGRISFSCLGFVIVTDEGLRIFTFTRHSLPLCSESSLTCHRLWHGASVFMDNSDYLRQSNLLSFGSEAVTTLYIDLELKRNNTIQIR